MESDERGVTSIRRMQLRPDISFAPDAAATAEGVADPHARRHEACFIANFVRSAIAANRSTPSVSPSRVEPSGGFVLTDRLVSIASIDATEVAVQQALHLPCGVVTGLFDRAGNSGDDNRLHPRRPGFEQTPLVVSAVVVAVLVAEVHLDPGQPILEALQRRSHGGFDIGDQAFAALDTCICIIGSSWVVRG